MVTQYSTGSTLESKWLMLCVHTIESRSDVGAGATDLFADPPKPQSFGRLQKSFCAQGTCPGRRPLQIDSVKVSCGGAGPGEQRRVGGQDNHPVRRKRWSSIAHNYLVFMPSGERESQRRSSPSAEWMLLFQTAFTKRHP